MSMELKSISSCRSCGLKKLVPILSLGEQYVINFLDSNENSGIKAPLELVLCDINSGGCGLLQLRHTVPLDLMYRQYWYKSGVNQTMRNALADVVDKAEKLIKLKAGDIVLDIGSNDSTLLRSYKTKGLILVGFEPATNLMDEARVGVTKVINDFFNYEAFKKEFGDKKAKIITAIAMFYDLDDPNKFVSDIVKCLDKDGVFIIQQNYLVSMLKQNAFDNISHEHLEYYSMRALKNLLNRHNLEIFDVELNDINGGSFRTYIRHKGCKSIKPFKLAKERLKKVEDEEIKLGLHNRKVYDDFAKRIEKIKDKIYNFIKKEVEKGKKVYVYGASTRGNTLLQYCGIDNKLIKAAAERNPAKWGKKTVGTWIPIISEEQARKEKPDYFLVLPWAFIKEFVEREKEFLESGGKFIVPLPEPRIISSNGIHKL
jgi:NDP-4-keto-2,6-dideoxyhexose 3-C-methyltransferase